MGNRPLLTKGTRDRAERFHRRLLVAVADGHVSVLEQRELVIDAEALADDADRTHGALALACGWMRGVEDVRYLSDLGKRARVDLEQLEAA